MRIYLAMVPPRVETGGGAPPRAASQKPEASS